MASSNSARRGVCDSSLDGSSHCQQCEMRLWPLFHWSRNKQLMAAQVTEVLYMLCGESAETLKEGREVSAVVTFAGSRDVLVRLPDYGDAEGVLTEVASNWGNPVQPRNRFVRDQAVRVRWGSPHIPPRSPSRHVMERHASSGGSSAEAASHRMQPRTPSVRDQPTWIRRVSSGDCSAPFAITELGNTGQHGQHIVCSQSCTGAWRLTLAMRPAG